MTRATPRRIGRVIGNLDDLATIVRAYAEDEHFGTQGEDYELRARLNGLVRAIQLASEEAEKASAHLNARPAPGA